MKALTAKLGGRSEGSSHLLIHGDVEVLVLSDLLIPLLNTSPNPAVENALQDGCAHIANPFLGDLMDLLGVIHVLSNLLMPTVEEGSDMLKGKAIILRNGDVPDVLGLNA